MIDHKDFTSIVTTRDIPTGDFRATFTIQIVDDFLTDDTTLIYRCNACSSESSVTLNRLKLAQNTRLGLDAAQQLHVDHQRAAHPTNNQSFTD